MIPFVVQEAHEELGVTIAEKDLEYLGTIATSLKGNSPKQVLTHTFHVCVCILIMMFVHIICKCKQSGRGLHLLQETSDAKEKK
jgi:hypothetical protein